MTYRMLEKVSTYLVRGRGRGRVRIRVRVRVTVRVRVRIRVRVSVRVIEDVGEGVDVLEAVGLECAQILEALPGVRVRVRGLDLGLG